MKVGAGRTAKEQAIYDKGLVAVLKSLHDDLDAAVLDAYGWRDDPTDEQILERLVALNAARSAEEAQGHVRWLRPEFQAPEQTQTPMAGLGDQGTRGPTICGSHEEVGRPPAPPAPWPNTLPEQIAALANALTPAPQTETELATLGRARQLEDSRWMG